MVDLSIVFWAFPEAPDRPGSAEWAKMEQPGDPAPDLLDLSDLSDLSGTATGGDLTEAGKLMKAGEFRGWTWTGP